VHSSILQFLGNLTESENDTALGMIVMSLQLKFIFKSMFRALTGESPHRRFGGAIWSLTESISCDTSFCSFVGWGINPICCSAP
jgi:hypothetical protein